jgi:hypothetical protein
MRKAIKDEFTDLPVSRQRKYQLRMARDGRCITCGEPAAESFWCLKHMVKIRERERECINQQGVTRERAVTGWSRK